MVYSGLQFDFVGVFTWHNGTHENIIGIDLSERVIVKCRYFMT